MQGRPNAIVDKKTGQIIVQTPLPGFNCLALEGGGVACAGHLGAIQVMEKYGVLDGFEYVSGISGGALAALGICLGYTAEEMTNILSNLPMEKFMERSDSWSFTPSFFSSFRKVVSVYFSPFFALSSGKVFLAWVQQMVKEKMGSENATFGDLARKIEEEKAENGFTRKKKLYIGGTNLSLAIPEVKILSAETEPDMPLAQAALISALYPFVFSPYEYKGHRWGDGGIKSILLTKIFDDKRFLPKGYDFTEKGVNPGVLAIKVDTYDEIMQVIWGVHKEVKINKTSEYAWQVANATADTTDITEIREARTVLPLADADVDRLDLYIPPEKTMRLVDEAIDTSKEFFENHVDAAYKVTTHKGIKEWLESQTIENIIAIRNTYKEMLSDLRLAPDDVVARNEQTEFNPEKPTIEQLENHIYFLKGYIQFVLKKHKKAGIEVHYPEHHINLKPAFPAGAWHEKLKEEMKARFEVLTAKIESAEGEYKRFTDDLADVMQAISDPKAEPFHGYHDEKVHIIASYHEYLNKLRDERDSIICKLGINNQTEKKQDRIDSVNYKDLYEEVTRWAGEMNLSSALKAVIPPKMPVFVYDTNQSSDIDFHVDLRNGDDLKVYLLAGMLYLEKRKDANKGRFAEVVKAYFSVENAVPASAQDLQEMLGVDGPELQLAMFKLEGLLHYFEKCEYPTYKPSMDLDVMFGLSKVSFFAKPKKQDDQDAIEMQVITPSLGSVEHPN